MRLIYLDDAIEAIASRDETDGTYNIFSGRQVIDILKDLPSAQPKKQASDEIYGMMKDYYFKHRNDHDDSWQGGFAKCMNLIPNMYERREDG